MASNNKYAMKRNITIAVYCSSRGDLPVEVYAGVWEIVTRAADSASRLIYGGVNAGLMHVVAEVARGAGMEVTGVIPEVFRHRADPLCSELVFVSDLNARKGKMIEMADLFIVLPGGIGTIDEWISTLSDIMVREKVDPKADRPILVWNYKNLYDGLVMQLKATAESIYARGKRVDRSHIFATAAELAAAIPRLSGQQP